MFLNEATIKNTQARLNELRIFLDDVVVRAIYWERKIALVRYVFNGEDVVSYIVMKEGDFVADALSEAIRCSDYYKFTDIEKGYEKDDSVDFILRVWPMKVADNVVGITERNKNTTPSLDLDHAAQILGDKFNVSRRKK